MITMMTTRKSLFSLASAIVLMGTTVLAQAATRNVPSQYPHLAAAIDAAAPGDTIVVAAGRYYQDYTINWVGKNLTIKGAGPGKSVLEGNASERLLNIQNLTSASRIEGFTFSRGWQAGGGGMLNENSSLTVANCEFTFNEGGFGAGMFNRGGSPTILNCTFRNNVAMLDGGGIYNDSSSATVIGCVFDNNFAGESGGGMFNDHGSNATVAGCTTISRVVRPSPTAPSFRTGR